MNIAEKIDHTILRADAREDEVKRYCREAVQYHFASVCVNTCHVPLVAEMLKESDVKVCCVVGFPLGAMSTRAKACEARIAVEDGAEEIDMVVNIGAVKDGNYDRVEEDIRAVVEARCGICKNFNWIFDRRCYCRSGSSDERDSGRFSKGEGQWWNPYLWAGEGHDRSRSRQNRCGKWHHTAGRVIGAERSYSAGSVIR